MRVGAVRLISWVLAIGPAVASAQVGEKGTVSTRSDVKMSIEGATGTSGKKLDALAATLGTPLGSVKRCYADLVKQRPDVVGTLPLTLTLPEKGKLSIEMSNAPDALKPMRRCIDQAFAKLDIDAVPRPAAARVTLVLTNTSANSVDDVRRSEQDASRVDVEQVNGGFRSRGTSTGGEVSFEVKGADRTQVERTHNLARAALPGLFDCRRRASKLASPAGEIRLQLKAGGQIGVASSTVPNERAPSCVASALKRARGKEKSTADLTIRFNAPP